MEITLNIPDDLTRQVSREGRDPARVVLEALALESYRAGLLSESAVRRILGFDTRMEVHASLKQPGACLPYELAIAALGGHTSRVSGQCLDYSLLVLILSQHVQGNRAERGRHPPFRRRHARSLRPYTRRQI